MVSLAAMLLASTPAFEPVREHSWGERQEVASAIESNHRDSHASVTFEPVAESLDGAPVPFLHYTFNTPVPFEFVALDFKAARLSRILYPLHLPSSEADVDKPATDVPEKFQAVRAWLTEHLGEPDVFTTSIEGRTAYFSDVESLLEVDAYTFNYTWCSKAANAYLVALRETGKSPIVVASLTPPAAGGDDACGDSAKPVQAAEKPSAGSITALP